ncbi:hypothetical protein SACS_0748 [Parasaccharibacter apium]|uniref:DUF2155 domain-containing protein n=1 Tax=Parasaccharibacter apium TaxID=1510841 RepID=A0A7U7J0T5_9PROT|nr:DUF2155 domain-containing protein [Parasaccharibacter apium]CDG33486.1 hypothetical protein SACS_0748 [Parasaccharibacter apium]
MRIRKTVLALSCLAGLLATVPENLRAEGVRGVAAPAVYPATAWQGRNGAVLRIMRRLDSHVELVPLHVGDDAVYGPLSLRLERCLQRPDGLPAQTAILLKIEEKQESGSPPFEGWMFTDDPALGAYAGALYDVQVVSCDGDRVDPMVGPLPAPVQPQLPMAIAPHVEADEGRGPTVLAPPSSGGSGEQGAASSGPTSLLPPAAPLPPPQPAQGVGTQH